MKYRTKSKKTMKKKINKIVSGTTLKDNAKYFMDNFLPPVLRDTRLYFFLVSRIYNSKVDPDFKKKVFYMSDDEFSEAYNEIAHSSMLISSNIDNYQINHVCSNVKGSSILEIGAGNGELSLILARKGYEVTASDISVNNINFINEKILGDNISVNTAIVNVEKIPYSDKSFDTVICLHTLEHVRNVTKAVSELKRVTKKRIIVIVPRERYFRYSINYHLNFFYGDEQLMFLFNLKRCRTVSKRTILSYIGDV